MKKIIFHAFFNGDIKIVIVKAIRREMKWLGKQKKEKMKSTLNGKFDSEDTRVCSKCKKIVLNE